MLALAIDRDLRRWWPYWQDHRVASNPEWLQHTTIFLLLHWELSRYVLFISSRYPGSLCSRESPGRLRPPLLLHLHPKVDSTSPKICVTIFRLEAQQFYWIAIGRREKGTGRPGITPHASTVRNSLKDSFRSTTKRSPHAVGKLSHRTLGSWQTRLLVAMQLRLSELQVCKDDSLRKVPSYLLQGRKPSTQASSVGSLE